MVLELTSTRAAQWPLATGNRPGEEVILEGVRKVRIEDVPLPLYLRFRKVQHFWIYSSQSTGYVRDFYDVFLAHFPSPTVDDLETFVQGIEAQMPDYDAAQRQAEAEARARSAEQLKGIKPWIRAQRR